MKRFCRAAYPKSDKAVALLRTYEVSARDKYENSKKKSEESEEKELDEDDIHIKKKRL